MLLSILSTKFNVLYDNVLINLSTTYQALPNTKQPFFYSELLACQRYPEIREIQSYNWHIYSISNSRNNHHSKASQEHCRTVKQGLLHAILQTRTMTSVPDACGIVFHVSAMTSVTTQHSCATVLIIQKTATSSKNITLWHSQQFGHCI